MLVPLACILKLFCHTFIFVFFKQNRMHLADMHILMSFVEVICQIVCSHWTSLHCCMQFLCVEISSLFSVTVFMAVMNTDHTFCLFSQSNNKNNRNQKFRSAELQTSWCEIKSNLKHTLIILNAQVRLGFKFGTAICVLFACICHFHFSSCPIRRRFNMLNLLKHHRGVTSVSGVEHTTKLSLTDIQRRLNFVQCWPSAWCCQVFNGQVVHLQKRIIRCLYTDKLRLLCACSTLYVKMQCHIKSQTKLCLLWPISPPNIQVLYKGANAV